MSVCGSLVNCPSARHSSSLELKADSIEVVGPCDSVGSTSGDGEWRWLWPLGGGVIEMAMSFLDIW